MSQQFCLKWNNHTTNMLQVFENLLTTEALVDVTLACDGLSLKAHKMVLSACSPFFQSLFLENPCKHPIVIMKDMRYCDLKAIIDFMYRGEVNVSHDQLSALLKTAETLKVKGLAEVTGENKQASGIVQQEIIQNTSTPTPVPPSAQRTDTPPLQGKRKRGRPRKRSLSDSNRSDDEGVPPKIKETNSDIEELSGDASMEATSDNRSGGGPVSCNSQSQVPIHSSNNVNTFSKSHLSTSQDPQGEEPASGDENEFEVEPSKLLEQTLTTENVPSNSQNSTGPITLPSVSGLEISRRSMSSTDSVSQALVPVSIPSDSLGSNLQGPDSPQDVKPQILSFDDPPISPVAGTSHGSDRSLMMYMDQSGVASIPGPSNFQDNSALVPHDSQPQERPMTPLAIDSKSNLSVPTSACSPPATGQKRPAPSSPPHGRDGTAFKQLATQGIVVNESNILRGQLPNVGLRMTNTSPGPVPSTGANLLAVQFGQHQTFGQTSQPVSQQSISMASSMPSSIQSKLANPTTVNQMAHSQAMTTTSSSNMTPQQSVPGVTMSTTQQNQPQANPAVATKDRCTIWQGILEFHVKSTSVNQSQTQRVSHSLPCTFSSMVTNGNPDVNADKWPNRLMLQLIPYQLTVVANFSDVLKIAAHHVLIHFNQESEALSKLCKMMSSGLVACIQFPQNCDIRIMVVLYVPDKKIYRGFIANDQDKLFCNARLVCETNHKQQEKQRAFTGNMPTANNTPLNSRLPMNQPQVATNNQPPPQAQALNATMVHSTNMNQQQPTLTQAARLPQLEAARQQNLLKIQHLQQALEATQQKELQFKAALEQQHQQPILKMQNAIEQLQQQLQHQQQQLDQATAEQRHQQQLAQATAEQPAAARFADASGESHK